MMAVRPYCQPLGSSSEDVGLLRPLPTQPELPALDSDIFGPLNCAMEHGFYERCSTACAVLDPKATLNSEFSQKLDLCIMKYASCYKAG